MHGFTTAQNPSGLDFDLSRSSNVKDEGTAELPIYGILLVFNSNV